MPKKTIRVEYYRLWEDHTWDTEFLAIPAETPQYQYEEAVRQAAAKINWREEPPVFVGLYASSDESEEGVLAEMPF